ncbi:MAG: dicarboxylate/amino acid:cation symporter [Gemmatimonadaceae bacterium]
MTIRSRIASPTGTVLIALALGLAAGIAIALSGDARLLHLAEGIEPVGIMWVNALRMTVIPLVVSLLITGVSDRGNVAVSQLGARSVLAFALLIGVSTIYAILTVPWSMHWLVVDPAASAAMRAGVTATSSQTAAAIHDAPGFRDWLISLIPTNPIQAAVNGALLPLIVFSLLFGLALSRSTPEVAEPVLRVFRALGESMLTLVRWVSVLAPIGVFALILPTAARLGATAVGALGYYVAVTYVLTLGLIVLLYPLIAVLGRVPLRTLGRALLPAQVVAFGTSSSIAALPALIDGADRELHVSAPVRGFVLPLAASAFKISSPIAKLVGALFLARFYGVDIALTQLMSLALVSVLLSVSTPGVPHGWLIVLAPMLASVGVPAEGIGLLMAVDVLPDMIYTATNATGYMGAAVLVERGLSKE